MATAAPATPVTPSRVSLPLKNKQVEDILMWRDPKKSGIALGAATAIFGTLQFATFNPIVAVAYVLISVILGCFIWNNIASVTHKAPVPVPAVLREGVSEADLKRLAEKGTVYVNKGLAYVHRLATGKDAVLTGGSIFGLYVVAQAASLVSVVGLLYTAVVGSFSLPKVYELKKDQIDSAVEKARKQLTEIYDKYLHKYASMIPRAAAARPAESSTETKKEE